MKTVKNVAVACFILISCVSIRSGYDSKEECKPTKQKLGFVKYGVLDTTIFSFLDTLLLLKSKYLTVDDEDNYIVEIIEFKKKDTIYSYGLFLQNYIMDSFGDVPDYAGGFKYNSTYILIHRKANINEENSISIDFAFATEDSLFVEFDYYPCSNTAKSIDLYFKREKGVYGIDKVWGCPWR